MTINAISTIQPQQKKNSHTGLAMAAGGALGAVSRYVIPAKSELKDGFFSSAQMNARGAKRSILKYTGAGALVAFGVNCLKNALSNNKKESNEITYSKYAAILDAPDYACEIMWLA